MMAGAIKIALYQPVLKPKHLHPIHMEKAERNGVSFGSSAKNAFLI
jgi:hypothetical protein